VSNAEQVSLRDYVEQRFDSLDKKIGKLDTSVRSLEISRATLAGKASQQSVYIAYAISVVGLVLGLIALFQQ
jgi:hypothetical protein